MRNEITLYKNEVYEGVWECYCKAVGVPVSAETITIVFDDGEVQVTGCDEKIAEFWDDEKDDSFSKAQRFIEENGITQYKFCEGYLDREERHIDHLVLSYLE